MLETVIISALTTTLILAAIWLWKYRNERGFENRKTLTPAPPKEVPPSEPKGEVFVATCDFQLGIAPHPKLGKEPESVTVHRGEKLLFDDGNWTLRGVTFRLPQLIVARTNGWLAPESGSRKPPPLPCPWTPDRVSVNPDWPSEESKPERVIYRKFVPLYYEAYTALAPNSGEPDFQVKRAILRADSDLVKALERRERHTAFMSLTRAEVDRAMAGDESLLQNLWGSDVSLREDEPSKKPSVPPEEAKPSVRPGEDNEHISSETLVDVAKFLQKPAAEEPVSEATSETPKEPESDS